MGTEEKKRLRKEMMLMGYDEEEDEYANEALTFEEERRRFKE
jgi:hypothetical protein